MKSKDSITQILASNSINGADSKTVVDNKIPTDTSATNTDCIVNSKNKTDSAAKDYDVKKTLDERVFKSKLFQIIQNKDLEAFEEYKKSAEYNDITMYNPMDRLICLTEAFRQGLRGIIDFWLSFTDDYLSCFYSSALKYHYQSIRDFKDEYQAEQLNNQLEIRRQIKANIKAIKPYPNIVSLLDVSLANNRELQTVNLLKQFGYKKGDISPFLHPSVLPEIPLFEHYLSEKCYERNLIGVLLGLTVWNLDPNKKFNRKGSNQKCFPYPLNEIYMSPYSVSKTNQLNKDLIIKCLLEHGANKDLALIVASQSKEGEVTPFLLLGANPNCRDEEGQTPLMLAVQNSKIDAVRELLHHKADIDLTDLKTGKNVISMSSDMPTVSNNTISESNRIIQQMLFQAQVENSNLSMKVHFQKRYSTLVEKLQQKPVKELSVAEHAAFSLEAQHRFYDSVHLEDKIEIVKEKMEFLLNTGLFDLNTRDSTGKTVFMNFIARLEEDENLGKYIEFLYDKKYKADLSLRDNEGKTVLMQVVLEKPVKLSVCSKLLRSNHYSYYKQEVDEVLEFPEVLHNKKLLHVICTQYLFKYLQLESDGDVLVDSRVTRIIYEIMMNVFEVCKASYSSKRINFSVSDMMTNARCAKKLQAKLRKNPALKSLETINFSFEELIKVLCEIGKMPDYADKDPMLEDVLWALFESAPEVRACEARRANELEDKQIRERYYNLMRIRDRLETDFNTHRSIVAGAYAMIEIYEKYIKAEMPALDQIESALKKSKDLKLSNYQKESKSKKENYGTLQKDLGALKEVLKNEEANFTQEMDAFEVILASCKNNEVFDIEAISKTEVAIEMLNAKFQAHHRLVAQLKSTGDSLIQSFKDFRMKIHSFVLDQKKKRKDLFFNKTNKKKPETDAEKGERERTEEREVFAAEKAAIIAFNQADEKEKAAKAFLKEEKAQQERKRALDTVVLAEHALQNDESELNAHEKNKDSAQSADLELSSDILAAAIDAEQAALDEDIAARIAEEAWRLEQDKRRNFAKEAKRKLLAQQEPLPDRGDSKMIDEIEKMRRANDLKIARELALRTQAAEQARLRELATLDASNTLTKSNGNRKASLYMYDARNAPTNNPAHTPASLGLEALAVDDRTQIISEVEKALNAMDSRKDAGIEYLELERAALRYSFADLFEVLRNLPQSFIDEIEAEKLRHLLFKGPQHSCLLETDIKAVQEYNQNLREIISRFIKVLSEHRQGQLIVKDKAPLTREALTLQMSKHEPHVTHASAHNLFIQLLQEADKFPAKKERPVPSYQELKSDIERCNHCLEKNNDGSLDPHFRALAQKGLMSQRSISAALLLEHYYRASKDEKELLRAYKDVGNTFRHAEKPKQ